MELSLVLIKIFFTQNIRDHLTDSDEWWGIEFQCDDLYHASKTGLSCLPDLQRCL